MRSSQVKPYEEVLYPGHAYHLTHPDRLALMGALFGLTPAPVEECRVLEIGCCDGGNLLPMAYTLPGSTFLGIDLAAGPIQKARADAAQLGLSNLRFEAMDILDFPADAGPFDYIIAHGVFSWVPPAVRDQLLAICGTRLSPHGIAYVSYKTHPGSYVTDAIHEMMQYQAKRLPDATEEEVVRAGLAMGRLVVNAKTEADPYRFQLKERLDLIEKRLDSYSGAAFIYYDFGVAISEAMYFHAFMEQAGRHGLQFLSEAALEPPGPARYTPETIEALAALEGDVIAQEQYGDFLTYREFRRTLLCRGGVAVDRALPPERIHPFHAAGCLQPVVVGVGSADDPLAKEEFVAPGGLKVTVDQPAVKSAFRRLGRAWPGSVSFDEMLAASAPANRGEDADHLARALLALFRVEMLELTTRPLQQATVASERPVASARLRQQIVQGAPTVTTLRHREMEMKDVAVRHLVALLDGTRDRAAMQRDLENWLETARPANPDLPSHEWVMANLEMVLTSFVRQHFLVA